MSKLPNEAWTAENPDTALVAFWFEGRTTQEGYDRASLVKKAAFDIAAKYSVKVSRVECGRVARPAYMEYTGRPSSVACAINELRNYIRRFRGAKFY